MTPEPIFIHCEGSRSVAVEGICPMCGYHVGAVVLWITDGLVPDHEREDIIAMIDRGDFG